MSRTRKITEQSVAAAGVVGQQLPTVGAKSEAGASSAGTLVRRIRQMFKYLF